jgi:hypothetical protein
MRWFLTAAVLAIIAPAAPACINDREVETHEREFKSQYLAPKASPVPQSPASDGGYLNVAAGGVGLMLLVGAAVVSFRTHS